MAPGCRMSAARAVMVPWSFVHQPTSTRWVSLSVTRTPRTEVTSGPSETGTRQAVAPGGATAPWRERKEAYLAHLAVETDRRVLRVSLADKVHNARAILGDYRLLGDELWSRFNCDADPPWYYRRLSEVFAKRLPRSPLTAEFARAVEDLTAPIAGAG